MHGAEEAYRLGYGNLEGTLLMIVIALQQQHCMLRCLCVGLVVNVPVRIQIDTEHTHRQDTQ